MRNHGLSGRSDEMTYAAMAQDLLDTLDANDLQKVTLIGHSMGGKAVMALTALAPERINGLVVIDVAPVDYDVRRHDEIFAAINAVTEAGVATRQQAAAVMREHLDEEGVVQFLLKSFVDGNGVLTCRCSGTSTTISWAGKPSPPGHTLPSLFAAATRLTLPTRTATRCWRNSRRLAPTSLPEPGTGCMRKNLTPCCAPFAAILLILQID
jgi:pimeloyl-ACP methyl ester carboxylesterase